MANSFTIPKSAYEGFDALIAIGHAKLSRLVEEVRSRRLTLNQERLVADLATAIGADANAIQMAADYVLIPLSGLRAEFKMSAEDFVTLITGLIHAQRVEWLEKNRSAWEHVSPLLGQLIAPNSLFAQLNKTYRLLFNRPGLVETIRLLTELRPVYDDEVTTVQAYIITSTMAVTYQESGEQKRVHLTMDRQDLERLQEQVERALRKIQLLERQVALLEVPSLVAGMERS